MTTANRTAPPETTPMASTTTTESASNPHPLVATSNTIAPPSLLEQQEQRRSSTSRGRAHHSHKYRSRSRSNSRYRSNSRHRSRRSRSEEDRNKASADERAATRDIRTVFVSQLQIRTTEDDVELFFSSVCKVVSVALLRDKNSHKSKGFGYVELDSLQDVDKAMMLNGLPFIWRDGTKGFPILVKKYEVDRDITTLKAQRAAGLLAGHEPKPLPPGVIPRPKIELVERVGEGASMVRLDNAEKAVMVPNFKGRPFLTKTLSLQGFDKNLTPDDAKVILESFGQVVSMDYSFDVVQKKNSCVVQFIDMEAAAKANNQLNGHELEGSRISCMPINDVHNNNNNRNFNVAKKKDNEGWTLDDDDDITRAGRGVKINADRRVELMSKLAGGAAQEFLPQISNVSVTTSIAAAGGELQGKPPVQAPPPQSSLPQQQPTRFVLAKNIFDPSEETEPNWDTDIQQDIFEECSKFGKVESVHVDKVSKEGEVGIVFENVPDAVKAFVQLNGRWFAKRQIKCFYSPTAAM